MPTYGLQQTDDTRVADIVRSGCLRVALFLPQYTTDPVTRELRGGPVFKDMLTRSWTYWGQSSPDRYRNPQAGRLAYINEFVEEAKASGLVQQAIDRAGPRGVLVDPAGRSHRPIRGVSWERN